jgi:hypothetical protein
MHTPGFLRRLALQKAIGRRAGLGCNVRAGQHTGDFFAPFFTVPKRSD